MDSMQWFQSIGFQCGQCTVSCHVEILWNKTFLTWMWCPPYSLTHRHSIRMSGDTQSDERLSLGLWLVYLQLLFDYQQHRVQRGRSRFELSRDISFKIGWLDQMEWVWQCRDGQWHVDLEKVANGIMWRMAKTDVFQYGAQYSRSMQSNAGLFRGVLGKWVLIIICSVC